MAAILQGRSNEQFSLRTHVVPEQSHCEVAAPTFPGRPEVHAQKIVAWDLDFGAWGLGFGTWDYNQRRTLTGQQR